MKLFNPTKETFQVFYNGEPLKQINSFEFEDYEEPQYSHVKKHLVDFVINKRGIRHTDAPAIQLIESEVMDV